MSYRKKKKHGTLKECNAVQQGAWAPYWVCVAENCSLVHSSACSLALTRSLTRLAPLTMSMIEIRYGTAQKTVYASVRSICSTLKTTVTMLRSRLDWVPISLTWRVMRQYIPPPPSFLEIDVKSACDNNRWHCQTAKLVLHPSEVTWQCRRQVVLRLN